MKQLKNIQLQENKFSKLLSEIKGLNFREPDGAFLFLSRYN